MASHRRWMTDPVWLWRRDCHDTPRRGQDVATSRAVRVNLSLRRASRRHFNGHRIGSLHLDFPALCREVGGVGIGRTAIVDLLVTGRAAGYRTCALNSDWNATSRFRVAASLGHSVAGA